MKFQKKCDCCGHQETAYAHPLNRGLVLAFKALAEYYEKNRRACNVNTELGLSHNQLANFQKLRYFGIVQDTPKGWFPTQLGRDWYRGTVAIMNPAGSLSNVPLESDHEAWKTHAKKRQAVRITDFVAVEYKKRDEYAGERLF